MRDRSSGAMSFRWRIAFNDRGQPPKRERNEAGEGPREAEVSCSGLREIITQAAFAGAQASEGCGQSRRTAMSPVIHFPGLRHPLYRDHDRKNACPSGSRFSNESTVGSIIAPIISSRPRCQYGGGRKFLTRDLDNHIAS